jgi:N-acetylneuraminic acid mutarotase
MFFALARRWFYLFTPLLILFVDSMPFSVNANPTQFSVTVKADCLGCTLAEQFPFLYSQLHGETGWIARTRQFGKHSVAGLEATVSSTPMQMPQGLKPLEQQAWIAMAQRGQMQLLMPQHYNGSTVIEKGAVRVEVQPIGAQPARAEQQGKTLVYKNAYPNTNSLQVIKQGKSEEFLYLRNSSAPKTFDYRVKVGNGVQVHSQAGSVAFLDSQGQGVRIEKPWLVDSNGQRSESAVHWQILEGGKHLRLVVMPLGLHYPMVVDPSWTTTGSMNMRRGRHTATLLPDGTVLVAGGFNSNNISALNSAELYNPQLGTWSNAGSMAISRVGHTATLLPNGRVLVAGGLNYSSSGSGIILSSAELYDPVLGSWSSTPSMSTVRQFHTATLLPNGKVLVAGGSDSNNTAISSAELYDPSTSTWSSTGSMTMARQSHTATLLPDGKVLVAGGYDPTILSTLSSAELYDPLTSTWSSTGSMTMARQIHTATLLPNGKVLVAGGSGDSADLYSPQNGTWSSTASMSTSRRSHTATLLPNGTVLVAGGFNGNGIILNSTESYDPAAGNWSSTGSMNTPRYSHTATLLPNSALLVAGGVINGSVVAFSAELYSSTPASLSYYSLTACRIVDTRKTASPSLPIGTPVSFVVNAGGSAFNYSSQGGSATGCGIPTDAKAVFFNFVAVNATGSGNLQAWPFGTLIPNASVLNYANLPELDIANGIVLPVCDPLTISCTSDLNVRANQSTAKLVIDVVGYFK